MRVLILGVGDAFTRRHFNSGALIKAPDAPDGPGGFVMIDCPDPIHRVLHEAAVTAGWKVTASEIHDIIITHLHGDHCNGLESFGFWHLVRRGNDPSLPIPRLHTHVPAAARLWEKLAPAMDGATSPSGLRMLNSIYEVRELDPQWQAQVAELTVRCRFTQHALPCTGLLISDGKSTLGWSGDTFFDPDHLDWLSEADLIVHEAGGKPFHTDIEQLATLPEPIRKKLRLIHVPDEVTRRKEGLQFLNEGDVLEL